jgi:hypothetical protein
MNWVESDFVGGRPKMTKGIWDINSEEDFFLSIKRVYQRNKSGKAKSIEDLLYVIMGLNHLREWIAHIPKREKGLKRDTQPHDYERNFCEEIGFNKYFITIKKFL